MDVARIVVGSMLLILGRKLYWLFVGVVGFALGFALATQFPGGASEWVILIVALVAGLVGALLAVFLQRVAIAVAGFAGGGYVVVVLVRSLGWHPGRLTWVPFVIGGIIGLVLVVTLFEWALIILSSLTGASLIVESSSLTPSIAGLLFVVLLIVGIGIQVSVMHRDQHKRVPDQATES